MLVSQRQTDESPFGINVPTGSTFTQHIRKEQEFVRTYRRSNDLLVDQFEHAASRLSCQCLFILAKLVDHPVVG